MNLKLIPLALLAVLMVSGCTGKNMKLLVCQAECFSPDCDTQECIEGIINLEESKLDYYEYCSFYLSGNAWHCSYWGDATCTCAPMEPIREKIVNVENCTSYVEVVVYQHSCKELKPESMTCHGKIIRDGDNCYCDDCLIHDRKFETCKWELEQ